MIREYSLHEIEAIRNAHERAPVQVRQLQPLVRVTEQEDERSLLKEAPAIVAAALKSGAAKVSRQDFDAALAAVKEGFASNKPGYRYRYKRKALVLFLALILNLNLFAADFLTAVSLVESSHNPRAVGDGGRALGLFQFHRDAWEVARRIDPSVGEYINATDPARARPAAAAYFSWLRRQFQRHGIASPTPAQIYAAWNCGFTGFRTKYKFDVTRTPQTTRRACDRIHRIINEK